VPYTADKPPLPFTPDELRARIPGWGADLDPADRPAVPREVHLETGAHWDLPEQQEERLPRERSIEHERLTPVFGTSVPLRGLSGAIRRYSYERYSEARAAHWLLLLAADRVDAVEAHVASFATSRPDEPVVESGILGERGHGPVRSRRGRVDVRHQVVDPLVVVGPWLLAGFAGYRLLRAVAVRARA
jgi:hypothetical protein